MNVLSFSLHGYCDYMVLKVRRGISVILKWQKYCHNRTLYASVTLHKPEHGNVDIKTHIPFRLRWPYLWVGKHNKLHIVLSTFFVLHFWCLSFALTTNDCWYCPPCVKLKVEAGMEEGEAGQALSLIGFAWLSAAERERNGRWKGTGCCQNCNVYATHCVHSELTKMDYCSVLDVIK